MGAEMWSTAGWALEPGLPCGWQGLVFWSQKEGLLRAEGTPAQEAEAWRVWAVLMCPPSGRVDTVTPSREEITCRRLQLLFLKQ